MNNEEKNIFNDKKEMLEYRKWIEEIEHNLEQRSHWRTQRHYWLGLVIIAIVAMALNAYILTHPNTVEKIVINKKYSEPNNLIKE